MEFSKPALTFQEQLNLLQNRGLACSDSAQALHYLQHLNYYRLAAYWRSFEADHASHRFREGASFERVLDHYIFDREFRLLLLDAIERIEVSVRSLWAYTLAHQYHPHAYLLVEASTRADWHAVNLGSLAKEIARSDEKFIQHYQLTYTQPPTPPIWAVSEIMSFGLLSHWITQLKPSCRALLADYYGMDQGQFRAFIRHLTYIRNLCAHHSRVWNRQLTVTLQLPKRKPQSLLGSFNTGQLRKVYNTLVMIAYLLDVISPGHLWKGRLRELLAKHAVDTWAMGFPDHWQRLGVWKEGVSE